MKGITLHLRDKYGLPCGRIFVNAKRIESVAEMEDTINYYEDPNKRFYSDIRFIHGCGGILVTENLNQVTEMLRNLKKKGTDNDTKSNG